MKIGARRSEKNCTELKILDGFNLFLSTKTVEEQPMYNNSVSQCSLWEGKEGAKGIYISMCFVYYRNWSQHDADYLFGINRQFSVAFRRMHTWTSEFEEF